MKTPWTDRQGAGRQAGFTLLEVLVALVVLGFLVVGLGQGVRTGLALWQAQGRRVDETAQLDAAARALRTMLSGIALSAGGAVSGAPVNAGFNGNADRLTFISDLPSGLGTTRRADISLELRRGRLVLRWTPHRHELSNTSPREPVETELIRGVERLDLAYWGSPGQDRPAGWQSEWNNSGIPELIRLRLVFTKGDPRRWPDLIAAPRV